MDSSFFGVICILEFGVFLFEELGVFGIIWLIVKGVKENIWFDKFLICCMVINCLLFSCMIGIVMFWIIWILGLWVCGVLLGLTVILVWGFWDELICWLVWLILIIKGGSILGSIVVCWVCVFIGRFFDGLLLYCLYLFCFRVFDLRKVVLVEGLYFLKFFSVVVWIR